MKHWQAGSVFFLIVTLAFAGCAKKSTEQASITGTGFDATSAPTEELAQLPQQAAATSQQAGVEVLPVEASPVTQGVPPIAGPALSAASQTASKDAMTAPGAGTGTLTHEQQIQTALKNAGFYSGAIDGKIGHGSKRAIEAFQKQNNLKIDGKVGPKTWAVLQPYLNNAAQMPNAVQADSSASADQ